MTQWGGKPTQLSSSTILSYIFTINAVVPFFPNSVDISFSLGKSKGKNLLSRQFFHFATLEKDPLLFFLFSKISL